ncbi:hypothetical protein BDR26DRAFT_820347 [Obelidium mucronatum]|nr:hypothetical protein BDR26DRAFT_820347 [Obelidium mucronatum]
MSSIADLGCGRGAILTSLIASSQWTRIIGVDLCRSSLDSASELCQPTDAEKQSLKEHEIVVELFEGSLKEADNRLKNIDAMICSEVVEHLDGDTLNCFPHVVLGTFHPKILIVTTPNAEFNINFPELNYGTPLATLRNDDHKFEWTRQEFEQWAQCYARQYGYDVSFTGVGLIQGSIHNVGFCTQAAIFVSNGGSVATVSTSPAPYKHHSTITFPFFNETQYSMHLVLPEILKEVQSFVYNQLCCECIPLVTPKMTDDEFDLLLISKWPIAPISILEIPVDSLWSVLRIRQICKTRDYLFEVVHAFPSIFMVHQEKKDIIQIRQQIPLVERLERALEGGREDECCTPSFSDTSEIDDE